MSVTLKRGVGNEAWAGVSTTSVPRPDASSRATLHTFEEWSVAFYFFEPSCEYFHCTPSANIIRVPGNLSTQTLRNWASYAIRLATTFYVPRTNTLTLHLRPYHNIAGTDPRLYSRTTNCYSPFFLMLLWLILVGYFSLFRFHLVLVV